jgi:prepilin-type N-terminal cleavage/methylation domain-containing protein
MRQTTVHSLYNESAPVPSNHGQTPAGCVVCDRSGFTLIEVIVSMVILLIVIGGMLGSFSLYYSYTTRERIRTIGQNLAQLQLEDVLAMDKGVLLQLTQGLPSADINYYNKPAYPPTWVDREPPVVFDHDPDPSVYDTGGIGTTREHDEPLPVDGTFSITSIQSVNVPSLYPLRSPYTPSGSADRPELGLPAGVVDLEPVPHLDAATPYWDFTMTLHKEVFPGYKRRIVIRDLTPANPTVESKIFRIDVTVYWTLAGATQDYTVSTEK